MAIVTVDELTRTFRTRRGQEITALDRVTFSIAEGETVGLLGPNGAGKTTLSRILATLLLPTTGTAEVAGWDVARQARQVRRAVGLVLGGERGLYRRLTARQNLRYWAALQGLRRGEADRRTGEVIERLGLGARVDDRVETFSRGMVQRVHLARALLSEPQVLIMDEPTNGMDPHARVGFLRLVRELQGSGVTILLTTHDMLEAQELCARVALVDGGRIVRAGATAELFAELQAPRMVTASGVPDDLRARLAVLPGVSGIDGTDGDLTLKVIGEEAANQVLVTLAGAGVRQLAMAPPNLADVYRTIITDREFAV